MHEPDSISPTEFAAGWMLDLFKDDGPSRLEMFQILEGLGLNVPPYGTSGILNHATAFNVPELHPAELETGQVLTTQVG